MSSPQHNYNDKPDSKGIKRKISNTDESEDKFTTPKRKKGGASSDEGTTSCVTPTPALPRTPVNNAGTPKTPASVQRKTVPLSERQQVALLKKIAAEEEESAPKVASPPPSTPSSAVKKTPADRKVNKRNERGETPLHLAAIRGDLKQCKKLIKAGGDVNVKDFAGWSPLHEACNHGWVVIAKQFLKAGADVNAQGLDNDTPLHDAAINGHEKLVRLLLRHGANPRQANLRGKSPLDVAAHNPDILRLLKGEYTASSSDSLSDSQYPTSPESNTSDKHDQSLTEFHGVPSPGSGGEMSSKGENFSSIKSAANSKTGGSPRLTLKFHTRERTKTRRNEAGYKSYSVTMETREEGEPYFSPLSSNGSDMGDLSLDLTFDGEEQLGRRLEERRQDFQGISGQLLKERVQNVDDGQSDQVVYPPSEPPSVGPSDDRMPFIGNNSGTGFITGENSDSLTKSPTNKNKESPAPPASMLHNSKLDTTTGTVCVPVSGVSAETDAHNKDLASQALPDNTSEFPKVPPLRMKIILPPKASQQSDLPYIVNTSSNVGSSRASSRNSSNASENDPEGKKATSNAETSSIVVDENSSTADPEKKEKEELPPRRTLRSHTQAQQQLQQQQQQKQDGEETNATAVETDNTAAETNDVQMTEDMNMHPKRRKRLRNEAQQAAPPPVIPFHPAPERVVNQLEVFLDIKRQIAQKWQTMYVVQPKPPSGFPEYLMNSANYVLEGNSASRLSVPMLSPPQSVTGPMRELFVEQEKDRYKLRLRHVMERDKLVLSFEQENIRIHGRAARAMANQHVPLSVCTILRDLEIYNALGSEHEEKNSRTRYNGRLLASWLQDLGDKYEKIKDAVLSRQHHEAESLYAVQKMVWEWKMKEVGLCEPKTTPKIDSLWVPMIQVSDELDLIQS